MLEHTLAVFTKKILPGLLFTSNPKLFLQWQGNFCKQAAYLNYFIIKEKMPPDYVEVQAWEGHFDSNTEGAYNHCWNYIIHKDDPKKNIICDFSSTIQNYFDFCEHNDPTLHMRLTDRANPRKIDLIFLEQLDPEKEFNEGPELYTGASGDEMKEEIKTLLQMAKLWKDEPDTTFSGVEEATVLSIE